MKNHRKWGVRVGVVVAACLWLALVAASWADAAETDEYSFKWLDPDKKIYVLQNRKFTKAGRPMLSALAGPGFSNSYRDTAGLSFRGSFFFSEMFGLEGFYTAGLNSENKTFEALKISAPNTLPVVREVRSQIGANFMYVPWYAKINVFNSVLYFDWYFSAGLGQMRTALDTRVSSSSPPNYEEKTYTSYHLGTGHIFHLSQMMAVRLDMQLSWFRAPILGSTGEDTWFNNHLFGFGLGVKL